MDNDPLISQIVDKLLDSDEVLDMLAKDIAKHIRQDKKFKNILREKITKNLELNKAISYNLKGCDDSSSED